MLAILRRQQGGSPCYPGRRSGAGRRRKNLREREDALHMQISLRREIAAPTTDGICLEAEGK